MNRRLGVALLVILMSLCGGVAVAERRPLPEPLRSDVELLLDIHGVGADKAHDHQRTRAFGYVAGYVSAASPASNDICLVQLQIVSQGTALDVVIPGALAGRVGGPSCMGLSTDDYLSVRVVLVGFFCAAGTTCSMPVADMVLRWRQAHPE